MADIFISYAKARRDEAAELAKELSDLGYSVWWDTSLVPTGRFADEIDRQLNDAKAVIVIWSSESVQSSWVRSEAGHGDRQRKLINTHTPEIDPVRQLPKPFELIHSVLVGDVRAVVRALDSLQVPRSGDVEMRIGTAKAPVPYSMWQAVVQASKSGRADRNAILGRANQLNLSTKLRHRLEAALDHFDTYCTTNPGLSDALRTVEIQSIEMTIYAEACSDYARENAKNSVAMQTGSIPEKMLDGMRPTEGEQSYRGDIADGTAHGFGVMSVLIRGTQRIPDYGSFKLEVEYAGLWLKGAPWLLGTYSADVLEPGDGWYERRYSCYQGAITSSLPSGAGVRVEYIEGDYYLSGPDKKVQRGLFSEGSLSYPAASISYEKKKEKCSKRRNYEQEQYKKT